MVDAHQDDSLIERSRFADQDVLTDVNASEIEHEDSSSQPSPSESGKKGEEVPVIDPKQASETINNKTITIDNNIPSRFDLGGSTSSGTMNKGTLIVKVPTRNESARKYL